MKNRRLSFVMIGMFLLLSACSGGGGKQATAGGQEADKDLKEPVKLEFMMSGTKEVFEQKYNSSSLLKQKYPNVTLEYLSITNWDELIAAGTVPDVVDLSPVNFYKIMDNGLAYDHTALLKKYNFDMKRFTPEYLELAKKLSGDKGLLAIPDKADFPYNTFALAYNKDLFDQFALPYPKSNMSWDEVIDLSKKFNRTNSNGVEIKGLTITGSGNMMRGQEDLSYLNPSGKVDLSAPGWSRMLETAKSAAAAQDNWAGAAGGSMDFFTKDKNVAMLAGNINVLIRQAKLYEDSLNWDMVTLPHFAGQPVTLPTSSGFFVITSKSQHKDIAMGVLDVLLGDSADRKDLENPTAMKKNLDAIKNQKMAIDMPGRYDTILNPMLQKKINDMIAQNKDVNTTLRELQEEMQQAVDKEENGQ